MGDIGLPLTAEWKGTNAVIHENDATRIVILPEYGGKIASLFDKRVNREWLLPPSGDLRRTSLAGRNFVECELFGWDECAPTINSCYIEGIYLGDHGDLWNQRWLIKDISLNSSVLSSRGRSLPFELLRRVDLTGRLITISYKVAAKDVEIPFLWAAHPQFIMTDLKEMLLPMQRIPLVEVGNGEIDIGINDINTLISSLPDGQCAKYYISSANLINSLTLCARNGSRLSMSWSWWIPYIGFWIDKGCLAKEPVICPEPSTGYYDSCEVAIDRGKILYIGKYETVAWQISLAMS
jgi:hypothetical protein